MIWKSGQKVSSGLHSEGENPLNKGDTHLDKVRDSVAALLNDERLSTQARHRLGEDYRQLQRLLDKLEKGHVYVAAFGRVSVGKSALLNALVGKEIFATGVLHGKTKHSEQALWQQYDSGGVFLLDTPGIDEVNGQEKAELAKNVARQADVLLFVLDSDMTRTEYQALLQLHETTQPMILVLNKADRLGEQNCQVLTEHLRRRVAGIIPAERVITASAQPDSYLQIETDGQGNEKEIFVNPEPDVDTLKTVLWQLLEADGKSYAALNAGVFAGKLSEKVGQEIVVARKEIADRTIRQYALFKAVGVAVNPIPAIDLLALAADASMVVHLSSIYGIGFTRKQAGELIRTIAIQMGILMGTVYGVNILSSVLKGLTAGISTIFTAGAQGAVAFYGSYVIGKAAERYFSQGASWGEGGVKVVIEEIMHDLDKDTLMQEAKISVSRYLGRRK